MSILVGNPFFLSPASGVAESERSLRFNSSDSAFLSRTPSGVGTSLTTWTMSMWVKRSKLGQEDPLFSAGTDVGDYLIAHFQTDDTIRVVTGENGTTNNNVAYTTAVFRDVAAWYHILIHFDFSNATSADRIKIYVNNQRIALSGTIAAQGYTGTRFNRAFAHSIGKWSTNANYSNSYFADIYFIDGQALDPTSFTEVSATTGQLIPKAYSGTYGTNGFYLNFADNSNNTATTLGKDTSGNGNNWTPNNLNAVAAGYQPYTLQATKVGGMAGNIANAFDGSLTGAAQLDPNSGSSYGGFTISPPITGNVIRLYGATFEGPSNNLRINNSTYYSFPSGAPGFVTISETSVNRIEGISAGGGGTYLYAIEVDGVLLRDTYLYASDCLVDCPVSGTPSTGTDPGNSTRGNYATLNPLSFTGSASLSDGNLAFSVAGSTVVNAASTIGVQTGKYYAEITAVVATGGIAPENWEVNIGVATSAFPSTIDYYYTNGGTIGSLSYATWKKGDVIGILLDCDAKTIRFKKNNSTVTSDFYSSISTTNPLFFAVGARNAGSVTVNFGQYPFIYPQTGYKSLCDTNLPAPVVAKPSTVMDVKLYTGNGSTQTISGLGFSPDLVWIKARSTSSYNHFLLDTVRGVNQELNSNTTDFEYTRPAPGSLTAFNSDGFNLNTAIGVNASSTTYAAWCFDAGSNTVSNTAGSITGGSQVRANPSSGFSVVTWTGQSAAATIGHGLNAAPSLIICKARSNAQSWGVYHKDTGIDNYLLLDSTGAATAYSGIWGSSAPTSTVFGVPGNVGLNNNSGWTYVAYCFSPVAGYSSFGSYTGNGSADGPFVFTGMRPRWVLFKSTAAGTYWGIYDAARNTYNAVNLGLYPNDSIAELVDQPFDFLSNGFKVRGTTAFVNSNGSTYIYAAFAESPFQYARAR